MKILFLFNEEKNVHTSFAEVLNLIHVTQFLSDISNADLLCLDAKLLLLLVS